MLKIWFIKVFKVSITGLENSLATGSKGKTMKKSTLKHFVCFQ